VINAVTYWDAGIDAVPRMTGAASVLDASDMTGVCERLGIALPLANVLDVGCGTCRLARICDGYIGTDIAPSAVAYCRRAGREALITHSPADLPMGPFGIVTCLSVFTHIDREARRAYLAAFAERTARILVDVVHGDEGGDIRLWRADVSGFVEDLAVTGFVVTATTPGVGISAAHTYYAAGIAI
jgi:SAM-dependent methyltransferase